MARRADVVIENADVRWRNFSESVNQHSKYDKARPDGKSINGGSFAIFLSDELADALWNEHHAKIEEYTNKRDPDAPVQKFIRVAVQFDGINTWKNPTIWQITGDSRAKLDEETMSNLDFAEVKNWDVSLNFSKTPNDKGQHKAFLNTLYATLSDNDLSAKYGF